MVQAVAQRLEKVSQGPAQPLGRLRVVAIRGPSNEKPEYRLLEGDAITAVEVTEVDDAGSVPTILVKNRLDARLFLMDGQELVGAKQNRILNTDVVVPARTELKIAEQTLEMYGHAVTRRASTR